MIAATRSLLEDPVVAAEIRHFEQMIERLERGEEDPDDFKRFRLENGVYGIRGTTDLHMVRVKVRFGQLDPDQLEALGEIAERFTPHAVAHLTTRQDVQFHWVRRRDVPAVLRRLAEAGLTTREACGNTVRNVTACPYAGVSPEEPFDVTPYADRVSRFFLRNPVAQNLPRKFKIAFEGCRTDHARTAIHDVGAVAAIEGGRRGFRLYVGGGLGPSPRAALLLEPFTPAEDLLPTLEAVIRVFDRHGNRENRNRARLKFLVKEWGQERFVRAVLAERRVVRTTRSGSSLLQAEALARQAGPHSYALPAAPDPATIPGPGCVPVLGTVSLVGDGAPDGEAPPDVEVRPAPGFPRLPGYERWLQTNVYRQKQPGWVTVTVRCPLGDITATQLRALAAISRRFNGGRIRTAITQNLLLRWVPEPLLPELYAALVAAGLGHHSADRIADITRCPGADTCNLAITHSRGLAAALSELFADGFGDVPEIQDVSIKISGCPNSCGQHHIADIGLYGTARKVGEREVPHYVLMVGGRTAEGEARFGTVVAQVPARRAVEAVRRILQRFREERRDGERFGEYVERVGARSLRGLVEPLQELAPYEQEPQLYEDLGAEGEAFRVAVGQGECAV